MFGVRSVRGVGNLTARAGRRFMGGSAEEAKHETFQWKKYSIIMAGVTGFFTVYNVVFHSHDHARTDMPYMKIRNKPYPWRECPDCNILDYDCWEQCRAAKK